MSGPVTKLIMNFPTVIRRALFFYRSGFFSPEISATQFDILFQGWHMISKQRGYMRSLLENQCVDRSGNPIPWYAYPAIEQLSKWDFSDYDLLEYGSGNSTLWWATRAKTVTSIESDEHWYGRTKSRMPANCRLVLSPVVPVNDRPGAPERWVAAIDAPGKYKSLDELERYIGVIDSLGEFDVIIIDGEVTNLTRLRCIQRALDHLRPGGLMIVDNSDWLPESCRYLRDAGFTEIDFCGLAPLNPYSGATSVFFRQGFSVRPVSSKHPGHTLSGYEFDFEPEDEVRMLLKQSENATAATGLPR